MAIVMRLPANHRGSNIDRSRRVLRIALILVVVAFFLHLIWQQGAEQRALMRLPTAERQQVFQRELSNFKTLCIHEMGAGPLGDQCRANADFLLKFPECDRACQALVREHFAHPFK